MRIAIATDWFAPRQGGIESQVASLAARLAESGHAVTVFTSTRGARSGNGYSVRVIDGARIPGTQVLMSPGQLGAFRDTLLDGFDVVHAHVSVISPLSYAAAFAAAARQVPTVLTFHSVLRVKRLFVWALRRLARRSADGIVWSAVSRLVASQLRGVLGERDVLVLPNGIDLSFWKAGAGNESRPGADAVTFVSTMRLQPKKRPRALLLAFGRAVRNARTPGRLILAGDGPELAALRKTADRLRSKGALVDLPGWQAAGRLRDLYAGADAFVLPSRFESFGLAALEARAAGLPVIAFAEAGCREFLSHGENAVLCESDDDVVDAMSRFLREPALRRRLAGDAGHLESYDWSAVLLEHERAYARAMSPRARQAAAAAVPA